MDISLRRLTIDDYEPLLALWKDAGLRLRPGGRDSRAAMTREFSMPTCAGFGLFAGNELIGAAMANFDGRRGWINRLAIDAKVRGIGLASRLISACEDFLNLQGALVIAALIDDDNSPSFSAFQKEGFSLIERVRFVAKYDPSDQ